MKKKEMFVGMQYLVFVGSNGKNNSTETIKS